MSFALQIPTKVKNFKIATDKKAAQSDAAERLPDRSGKPAEAIVRMALWRIWSE